MSNMEDIVTMQEALTAALSKNFKEMDMDRFREIIRKLPKKKSRDIFGITCKSFQFLSEDGEKYMHELVNGIIGQIDKYHHTLISLTSSVYLIYIKDEEKINH